ncbi:MAG: hypothetical protein CVV02_08810 [Firmicutes bacterium HGW-Firmicutes-7]|nr:MAG: hypothetical protein CVV02_08810 [Firmicutes bacterium HGW-Firmicutes-7]
MKKPNFILASSTLILIITLTMNSTFKAYAQENFTTDQASPPIISEAAILIDATTGQILYSKNETKKYYPASITKLMTALLAIEALNPEDTITFSRNAVLSIEFGSSHIGIKEDEVLTIDQAMHGLLLMSANEIANGLAEKTSGSIDEFAHDMNDRLKEIGAFNTHFVNPNGLHDENHYTTAYDMALITKELIKNEYYLNIMKDITYQIPLTNLSTEIRYLSQQHKMMNEKRDATLYRDDVIAGKTGFTNEAGHTLVTVAKKDDQVLIVVLLKSSSQNMYEDTSQLLDYGFSNFKPVELTSSDYEETLPILQNDSKVGEAIVTLNVPLNIYIESTQEKNSIEFKSELSVLTVDAKKGDTVGTVSIFSDGTLIATSDAVINDIDIVYFDTDESKPEKVVKSLITVLIPIIIVLFLTTLILYCIRPQKHYSKYKKKNSHRR